MGYKRATSMRDALMEGLAGLGQAGNEYAKTASQLKLQAAQLKESEQAQQVNQQTIDKNKQTAAQVLQQKQLIGTLEDAGSMAPAAMTGTGPANAVNMDEIKAAKKYDAEAKLYNSLNMGREGFQPISAKDLKKMGDEKALEGNRADQKGVLGDELQSRIRKDDALGMGATEKAFYGTKPEALGEKFKPIAQQVVSGEGGIYTVPSRVRPGTSATATPLKTDAGEAIKPLPRASDKSLAQIEAEARARAEGTAAGAADKALSGDAAKLTGFVSTLQTQGNTLKKMIEDEGIRKVVLEYKKGNPKYVNVIEDMADAKGRLRSGGAVNVDEANRFKQPFTGLGNLVYGDDDAAIAAINQALSEAETVKNGMGPARGKNAAPAPGKSKFQILSVEH